MLSTKPPLPIKPLEKAADFIKRLPIAAFKEGEAWDVTTKENVALEARQVGMIDCRPGSGGTDKELAQMDKLNHSIFELIENDSVFASQIDPVYVVFKFPGNGLPPDGWHASVLLIPEAYRGVQVMPGCNYLYQMTSNGNAGREEAMQFGGRLQEVFQDTTFSVLVTQAPASLY